MVNVQNHPPYSYPLGSSLYLRSQRNSLSTLQWGLAASVSSLILRTGRPLYNERRSDEEAILEEAMDNLLTERCYVVSA